jgi:hypothetical protein
MLIYDFLEECLAIKKLPIDKKELTALQIGAFGYVKYKAIVYKCNRGSSFCRVIIYTRSGKRIGTVGLEFDTDIHAVDWIIERVATHIESIVDNYVVKDKWQILKEVGYP